MPEVTALFEIDALVYFGLLRQIWITDSAIAHNVANCRTCESPAPKANDDLAKATFCSEIAKEKNAQAFGVRWTGWLGDVLLNRFS